MFALPSGSHGAPHPACPPDDVSAETSEAASPSGPQDPEHLSDEALESALCTHAAHIAAAECRFTLMVAEVDRRGIWADQGARSCAHWLSWRCGLSEAVGREHVRVGRALGRLPVIRQGFARGELSYSKVRAMTRVATPATEATLVEMAACATASQLERIVAAFRRAAVDEGAAALRRHRERSLCTYTDDDGMVVIKARLSPEDGATVLAAIEATRQELDADSRRRPDEAAPDVSAETPDSDTKDAELPFAAGHADALVAICEAHLASTPRRAFPSGPRASVVVHTDRQVLADAAAEGCAHIEGIGAISAHTVQRLVCDAAVSALVFDPDGTVTPEGHTRQVPDSLRRAVLTRDGGCRWPGCNRHRYVDVHHVVFVSHGGRTRLTNLAALCRAHHRLVHEGGYRLDMDARARITVETPEGQPLPARTDLPRVDGRHLIELHEREGRALDEHTMPVGGEPYDLGITVDVLVQAQRAADTVGASPSAR